MATKIENPHPDWSPQQWIDQARHVGFDTDEEEDFYMYLVQLERLDELVLDAE